MNQPDLFDITKGAKTGSQLRDEGMKKAENTANEACEDWSKRAIEYLEEYCRTHPQPFKCEDVRRSALFTQVPLVGSAMAWGGIMVKGKNKGWIEKIGVGPVKNPAAHCANAGTWVSLIYKGEG